MQELPPPIPYPGPSPKRVAEKSGELTFKVSFWTVFVLFSVYAAILFAMLAPPIFGRSHSRSQDAEGILIGSCIGLVCCGLVCREVFKVIVSRTTIRAHNCWCLATSFDWQEIENWRPLNICGLRYVRLYSSQEKRVMWLPLYLSDMKGFKNAVTQFAPPENPLRRYLEQHTK